MIQDPRHAKDLDAAARNPDGSYNGIRMLSWLSEVLHPGAGLNEEEVRAIAAEAQRRRERP